MKADLPWTALTQESAGARKAALVLHGLGPKERGSVLSCLPPGQRETVGPLLAELQALGLPQDRTLVDELLDASRAQNLAGEETTLPGLAHAGAPDLQRLLAAEPAGLVAVLLNAGHWPWTPEFLATLPESRRRQVEEARKRRDLADASGCRTRPAALEAELLEQVQGRLASVPREQPHGRGAGGWSERLVRALWWRRSAT